MFKLPESNELSALIPYAVFPSPLIRLVNAEIPKALFAPPVVKFASALRP